MMSSSRKAFFALSLLLSFFQTQAFVVIPSFASSQVRGARSTPRFAIDKDFTDDATLLKTVQRKQLVELCEQCQLSTTGTKEELLARLREFANAQAQEERQRRVERKRRIEEGSDNSKERYEVVSQVPEEDEEEDETFFYFPLRSDDTDDVTKAKKKESTRISSSAVTAPPPPPATEPNQDGERTVQIFSSTDQNDLTGIAAAQPGQSALGGDALTNAAASSSTQPWDAENAQTTTTTSKEVQAAKETVTELVQTLLAMTGAPAFSTFGSDGDDEDDDILEKIPSFVRPKDFVGFNPAKVPTTLLASASQALRTGRGKVLQEVLRQFELQAIGQDGMAGDDREKGGGHYQEVAKVRAFLEGFRRAEVRRLARETAALLLDRLITEGVEGLDMALATMGKASDDTSDHAGELNDSLLDYLNDAIRQQQKKLDEMRASQPTKTENLLEDADDVGGGDDRVSSLWTVEEEDGVRVESIDPNDPKVKQVLKEEASKAAEVVPEENKIPSSAPEQLLLLLTMMRERIKAEAAFGSDEKGRNLRLLAYCLRVPSREEREKLILREVGGSLDQLDSFIELVASSIEYGESTSHQLQPTRKRPLNLRELRSILDLTQDLRQRQSWKASGLKP